jgi:hypothetical protein
MDQAIGASTTALWERRGTGAGRRRCCEAYVARYEPGKKKKLCASEIGVGKGKSKGRDGTGARDGGDKKEGDDSRGVALRGPELLARDSYRRARLNSTIYPGFHTRDDSCVNPVHSAPNRDGLAHSKLSAPPAFPDAATFGSGGGR